MIDDFGRQDRAGSPVLAMSEGPWGAQDVEGVSSPVSEESEPPEDRNPWVQPPRRRPRLPRPEGTPAPSLEEILRRSRARFGGGLPTGGRPIWGYALGAFVLLWLATTSVHRIDPQERGIVTRFGRYERTLQPGVGVTLPAPVDVVTRVNVDRIHDLDVPRSGGENLLLTADRNLIDMAYTVRWSIRDPRAYLFAEVDPEQTVREVAESTMRAAVIRVNFDEASAGGRDRIEAVVAQVMQSVLDRYHAGIEIQGVTIRSADPPTAIAPAIKAVAQAQAQADAAIDAARSYAQTETVNAQTSAAAFDKVYDTYKLAPAVTRSRIYYETMEAVLAKTNKVIVDTPGVSPTITLPPASKPDDDGAAQAQASAPASGGNSQ